MSCFNAGQDGNGIILQYGRWKMIQERYAPKMIIYDVTPGFDLVVNDNMAYIDRLKPFCDDSEVRKYVASIFPMERWKMFSQMYRYNYKFLEMGADCMKSKEDGKKGYIPLYGQIRKEIVWGNKTSKSSEINYDETKLQQLECLAQECKAANTQLIFVVSPYYKGGGYGLELFEPVANIASKYDVPFYFLNEGEFIEKPEIFKDSHHLNDEGAYAFTNSLISRMTS